MGRIRCVQVPAGGRIGRSDLGAKLLSTDDEAEARALAEHEELAEHLRLAYVAVTRAEHRCTVVWGNVNGGEGAGLAYLLHQPAELAPGDGLLLSRDASPALAAAVEQAFRGIDKKGIILFFAIPNRDIAIPIPDFWRNELTVTSSYGAAPADLEAALNLIATQKINVKDTITQVLPLKQIQEGFRIVAEARESLKVVLEP